MTPHWVTQALLPHLPERIHTAWEPAAGSHKMAEILAQRFIVPATDLATGHDFLKISAPLDNANAIITNPPYTLATEFCEHALRLMEPVGGVVAMLLRTDFDHAKSRAHLFRDCPAFAKKQRSRSRSRPQAQRRPSTRSWHSVNRFPRGIARAVMPLMRFK